MKIAVDAMGGDNAPEQVVLGAIEAAQLTSAVICLVGQPAAIEPFMSGAPANVTIQEATEVVGMDEKPTDAMRKKKDSSISVCVRMVKEGQADAMVSAGNTGAVTAACLVGWRQVQGVHRPAIGTIMPNRSGAALLLDAGASPDVDPEHLVEFAKLGRIYAQCVMGRPNPRVSLLNIGEEPGKGNAFAKRTYELLSIYPWFAGNVEGKDMFHDPGDVVVCDAFVGNIFLKTTEGVAEYIVESLKAAVPSGIGRLAFLPMKSKLKGLFRKMDYAEYGGSPLLGLNGNCVICHGRSNAKAINNAIRIALEGTQNNLIEKVKEQFASEEVVA